MPDYKNGKIYKIECQETNRIYIGSTCQPTVAGRLRGHVQQLACAKKGLTHAYMSSFSILESGNYKCLLLCNYPCNTKDELTAKEAEYIRQYKNDDMYECVNMCIPGRNRAEYRKDNAEKIKQYDKQYRKDNEEKVKAKVRCGCGGKYTMVNKARHGKSKKHMKWEATK